MINIKIKEEQIDKINGQEIDKIHEAFRMNGIPSNLITGLLNIDSISELNRKQYNLLLLMFEALKGGNING